VKKKKLIKKSLKKEARRRFETYGLQKTTVDEIVYAANISKGSFTFSTI
jgi:AcrR family transcriptional regulator